MPTNSNLVLVEQIYGPTENDRLNMFDIPRDGGFDFHSLVWERKDTDGWKVSATVTREQFQGTHRNRRFVTGLYSLDPQRGWAVLKIGEGDSPEASFVVTFNYSWRTWDLIRNCEIGKLKDCKDPFDSLG
jgi:hypothetical protein